MSIFVFLIVLAVLVLSHEFGHFIVAKKSGVRVDEFGFGFPPRLFKFKKGETTYSINLIPFGGFVKIYGEEGENKEDTKSFGAKSIRIKTAVIAAGVVFNLLLAWVLLSGGFLIGLPTSVENISSSAKVSNIRVVIVNVIENSPASISGIKPGDELIGFNKASDFQSFIEVNKGKEIEIKYKRGNDIFSGVVTPRINPPAGQGAIGVALDTVGNVRFPIYSAIWEGLKATYYTVINVSVSIFYFIVNAIKGAAGFESVTGPVGIVGATGVAAKMGFSYLLSFIAFLSINLAIINIIPFPALDGGRLLFLLIEKIKGSPVSPKVSSIVHGIGLIILLLLMVAITYHDILKII